jgi:hypothetical protein
MHRILICLPLCFCLVFDLGIPGSLPVVFADEVKDSGAKLPNAAEMERLAREQPIAFLENCLIRYMREVKGYTLTLQKQETIDGKINPTEVIDVTFLDKPHSVYFKWVEGARLAERALFVEGENYGKMLARPQGAVARLVAGDVVAREVSGKDAKQSGRYTLNNFGFKKSMERSLRAWKAAREDGSLQIEFLGTKKVKEIGDRTCYAFRRIAKKPEEDVKESTLYFDTDTWLQVGVVLKDDNGLLQGSYYFRDVKLNPEIKKEQFTAAALKP